MSARNQYAMDYERDINAQPFSSAEEAWFWFIQAYDARQDGAKVAAGNALFPRPCEPMDVLCALDKLYRNRRLVMDHMLVLRHYGRRLLPPDPNRPKEKRAYYLWREALDRLETPLKQKGIVEKQNSLPEILQ